MEKEIDSVKLAEISPERIKNWKQQFLNASGNDAKAKRSAITTVNSLIRNAKALFSKKLLTFIRKEVELPSPLPFDEVTMEKAPSPRYRSKIDPKNILTLAHTELKIAHPEAYKILLLALLCGLRVSEIDYLLWDAFDFESNSLTIRDTKYHRLKSEDSAGVIQLSQEMSDLFYIFSTNALGEFVIESKGCIERSSRSSSYRCKGLLQFLQKWLKDKGIVAAKPIHELRKEIGSILATEKGIFAASRYLRHSDIRITASIYADQKESIIPSVASLV